ncbi:hypothetical protein F441_20455 [Phytophthora nicotianae CJ01A1]|nr:hypothetical protein L915_20000 [Phytophthora nicotianae]ETL24177.1 hypothetical protein L916_21810 [Phytophthora nicotianae]ETM48261.1 hypothetical protein L914_07166 [Phytophthora nicotianae]ETO58643.1 hypothetical protein F444_22978 [Phytophthora nicotianae P1976]ETP02495.1 hypothetical protein F441_20455 [Phytophthora nicotianae CJ01A1]
MEDYICKLRAVETELQELLEQELNHAYQLSSKVSNPRASANSNYVPSLDILLEECSKRLRK